MVWVVRATLQLSSAWSRELSLASVVSSPNVPGEIKFSIVIPLYNRAHLLTRLLDSLAVQTESSFEVIICDDGSDDNPSRVLKLYDPKFDLFYFRLERFGGPAKARNFGVSRARGNFVCFLDSDDFWHNTKLEECDREIIASGADFLYHDMAISYDEDSPHIPLLFRNNYDQVKVYKSVNYNSQKALILSQFLIGNRIPFSSVVVRRSLHFFCGGFNESPDVVSFEDHLYILNLLNFAEVIVRLRDTLGFYTVSSDSISLNCNEAGEHKMLRAYYKSIDCILARASPTLFFSLILRFDIFILKKYISSGSLLLPRFFFRAVNIRNRVLMGLPIIWLLR
jgi:glycosyltransferase involved in cell wall biosynthesis